jgi:hypothetical protein
MIREKSEDDPRMIQDKSVREKDFNGSSADHPGSSAKLADHPGSS